MKRLVCSLHDHLALLLMIKIVLTLSAKVISVIKHHTVETIDEKVAVHFIGHAIAEE